MDLGKKWYERIIRLERTRLKQVTAKSSLFFLLKDIIIRPKKFEKHNIEFIVPKSPNLCFVIITENHLAHFRPIAQELRSQKIGYCTIFTDFELYLKEKENFDNCVPINFGYNYLNYMGACIFQFKIWKVHHFKNDVILSNNQYVIGIQRYAKAAYLLHSIFKQIAPKFKQVILFKAEGFQSEAILSACKSKQIPTTAIQHGLINISTQFSDLQVDRYFVWSDFFKKRLQESKADCQIVITGNAAYDKLFKEITQVNNNKESQDAFHVLALPNSGISHTPIGEVHLLLNSMLKLAKEKPNYKLTIKPHPADIHENVRKYLNDKIKELPNTTLLGRFDKPPFSNANIVVINNSTAGLEAAIWGRPLLVVATSWEEVMVKQYIESGIANFATTTEEFVQAAEKTKNQYRKYQAKCKTFVSEQLAFPGQATHKIIDELLCATA